MIHLYQTIKYFSIWSCILFIFFSCSGFSGEKEEHLFRLLKSSETGITFNNALEESHELNIITYQDFYSGGGISIGDINNDGLSDIFLTGNMVSAKLYLNKGDFKFEDITESAGLGNMGKGWYTGTSFVDINEDGYLDIYIGKSGMEEPEDRTNLLFINNCDGTFIERARDYNLDHSGFAVNAHFFDYDKDGDLDIYLVNQGPEKFESGDAERLRNEVHIFAGDKLFENIGNKFIDVTTKAGIYSSVIGFAHGVSIGDLNNDDWDDIFVSNDFFEHDYIYLNNGDKTFREVVKSATQHISYYSMGNDMADYNNDGLLDIVVLDMVAEDNRRLKSNLGGMRVDRFWRAVKLGYHYEYMFNMLHLNNGNETFSEIGMMAGISYTDWSWAPLFADFDNDGYKDLFISNGIRKDIRNIDWGKLYYNILKLSFGKVKFKSSEWNLLLSELPFEKVKNYMFKNNGDLTFTKVMDIWGLNQKSWSNGAAFGDLDNDGDLDLVVNNIDDEAFIYENRASKKNNGNFLRLKFIGSDKNTFALGTKVKIVYHDRMQYQQLYLARGYRSSMEPVMHFGLNNDTIVQEIQIIWPDGRTNKLKNIRANQLIMLDHSNSEAPIYENEIYRLPFFEDVTETLSVDFRHQENEMDDFSREPLLPYKLSTLGPPLAVADINGDHLDDYYIGGALRYPGQLFIQDPSGKFLPKNNELWQKERMYEDIDAEFFDSDNDGDLDLYVVSGGNEFSNGTDGLQDRLYINDGEGNFTRDTIAIPNIFTSGSIVIPADYDKDGDLDLFIGGRMIPGKYPFPANSYILQNHQGKYEDITDSIAPGLRNLGMVTAAVWSDFDLDRDLDLIITGEWMPITLFKNQEGKFMNVDNMDNGLRFSEGWWQSLVAHDFDGDGDEDLVAGNLGLNYKYKAKKSEPFQVYCDDFDQNGSLDIVLTYFNQGKVYPVTDRRNLIKQLPVLNEKIPTNDEYSISTIEDIFSQESLNNALHYNAYTFASSYIENLGNGKFLIKPFENLAQISNINSIVIEDINKDGFDDLIMAGNLYSSEIETIRNDAGIGTFLKGDGEGNFKAVPYLESGLYTTGDIRDMKKLMTVNGKILLISKNNDFIQAIGIKDRFPL